MASELPRRIPVRTMADLLRLPPPKQQSQLGDLANQIRAAYARALAGREEWIAGTLELAESLAAARARFRANQQFHHWLSRERIWISHADRAALIQMGRNLPRVKTTLAQTESQSWRLVWRKIQGEAIAGRLSSAAKTDESQVRPEFAHKTMEHFRVTGPCVDPTRGLEGGFYSAMPSPRDYCEIQRGRDFLEYDKKVRWTVGNPPWENETFKPIALHAYKISQHVVWLLRGDTMTTNRVRDYLAAGFDVREEITVRWEDAFVATRGGYRLVLMHLERGYRARERTYWL